VAGGKRTITAEKGAAQGEMVKTTIYSKFISVKRKSGIIEFLDNVIVEQEDISFLADRMLVYYDENKKEEVGDAAEVSAIKKIDAFGHVKIFNQEFVATGQTGSYDPALGVFTIEENVTFNNGTSLANGNKFVYNVETKKSNLFGNDTKENGLKDNRVLVIIGEEEKDKKDKKDKKNKKSKQEEKQEILKK
jgi:lipopolysaccharide transport protein LptA